MGTPKRARQGGQTPSKIFSKAQEAATYKHEKYQKQLLDAFIEAPSEETFSVAFSKPLKSLLASPYAIHYTKRMITLLSGFIVDVIIKENKEGRETLGTFLQYTFNFLIKVGKYDDKNFRFNVCVVLNQVLHQIAKQELDMEEELCDRIINFLITERICDKMTGIREEAAKALQWLQDESKPQCNVTRTLMFHMERDPSCDVRRAILKVIRVTGMTLPAIVRRTRDVKESIRVDAYKVLGERRKMTSLSFATRERVILCGLRDESEAVRNTVICNLLPSWLNQMEKGLLQFVRELDSETHPHVPQMVMQHLFKTKSINELLAPLKPEGNEKFVDVDDLDPPLALYWSCLAQYLKQDEERKEEAVPALETILPSVTELCNYIEMFFETSKANMAGQVGEELHISEMYRVSTLVHLLGLIDACDLTDEAGRDNLGKLLERMLLSTEENKRVLVTVTKKLVLAYPEPCQRADAVLSVIEDLHKPLQRRHADVPVLSEAETRTRQVEMAKVRIAVCNLQVSQEKAIELQDFIRAEQLKDEIKDKREQLENMEKELHPKPQVETEMEREEVWDLPVLFKCLTILTELLKRSDVFKASIGLADVMENFVVKCLSLEDEQVMPMAVEILGMYCLQRVNNAKKSLPIFYAMLNHDVNYSNEVRAMCVRCICANIVHHGLTPFNIPEEEPVFAPETRCRLNTSVRPDLSFFSSISYLMEDPAEVVRTEAINGLCKMVMSGRITSIPLLSKLLLLWFNPPTSSNKRLMKILGQFLTYYPAFHHEAPKWLIQTLLPTLDTLMEAPHTSSLVDVDPKEVGLFILDMTRPGKNKHYKDNPHDEIMQLLLQRIYEEIAGDTVSVLLRLCINLQVSLDNDEVRLPLLDLARKLKKDNLVDKKNKDIDKVVTMLRANDAESTQSSQLTHMDADTLSQDSQESGVSTLCHPAVLTDSDLEEDNLVTSTVRRKTAVPRAALRGQGSDWEFD